jgi:hypothetical protein
MQRKVYGVLTMLAVALIVSVPMVQAQTPSRLRADVPFAFSLADKSMPAGNYEIRSLSDRLLEVWNLDIQHGQMLMKQISVQDDNVHNAKLVFHKYGDQYFLSQIWDGRSNSGVELAVSNREKEERIAQNGLQEPETVVVAMK